MMTNKELADWIAINIMGWKKEKKYGTPPYGIFYWVDESLDYKWVKPAQGWGNWQPTESISHAFQVVEKMDCYFQLLRHSDGTWFCAFVPDFHNMSSKRFCRNEKTAPLAICHAAKKAVEGVG